MTIARVSQLPAEALTGAPATGTPVRTSQLPAEALTGAPATGTPIRSSTLSVEGVYTLASTAPVRNSQLVVEAIYIDPPPVRLSQYVAETVATLSPPIRLDTYAIEAIYKNPPVALPDNLLWTYTPNWADRYTERLEFRTWQAQSHGGQGQRAALRDVPRLSVEFAIIVSDTEAARVDLLLAAGQSATYLLPRWHLGSALGAELASGVAIIYIATAYREFAVGGYALIRSDSQTHELVRISAIFADHLVLDAPVVNSWPSSARLYPVARAILQDSQQVARWTPGTMLATMQFELLGVAAPAPYSPPHALTGDPIWLPAPNSGENQSVTYTRQQQRIDYGFVEPHITDAPGRPFIRRSGRYIMADLAQIAAWRGFLAAGQGKRRRFWRPVYEAGLTLTADALATDLTLSIAAVGYASYMFPGLLGRLALVIRDTSGAWTFCHIAAIAPGAVGIDTITLAAALGRALPVVAVAGMYFMELVTHDSDVIEVSWFTADSAEAVLATTGVDQ